MNLDELTIGEAKELARCFGNNSQGGFVSPVEEGKSYLFEGVTKYFTGRVREIKGHYAELEDCAWIPFTGRFNEMVKTGFVEECEPCHDGALINLEACNDIIPWPRTLPTEIL